MITDKDVLKLEKHFVNAFPTKAEFNSLKDDVRLNHNEEMTTLDNLLGKVLDLIAENKASHGTLRRHDSWIRKLAGEINCDLQE